MGYPYLCFPLNGISISHHVSLVTNKFTWVIFRISYFYNTFFMGWIRKSLPWKLRPFHTLVDFL